MKRAVSVLLAVILMFCFSFGVYAEQGEYTLTYSAENPLSENAIKVEAEDGYPSANMEFFSMNKQLEGDTLVWFKTRNSFIEYDLFVPKNGIYRFVIRYFAKDYGEDMNRIIDIQIGDNDRQTLFFEKHGDSENYEPYYASFEVELNTDMDTVFFWVPEIFDDDKYMIIDYDWFAFELIKENEVIDDTDQRVEVTDRPDNQVILWGGLAAVAVLAIIVTVIVIVAVNKKKKYRKVCNEEKNKKQ